jgi:hypothetical protein
MAGGQGTDTGLITQQLIADIRDMLQDFDYKVIPNDAIILNSLNKWQARFMIECKTTKNTFSITLQPGTAEYTLDESVLSITKSIFIPKRIYLYNWKLNGSVKNLKLYNPEIIQDGDTVEIEAYIKPKTSDKISKTKDPVIQTEYHTYLKDGVLSEIPTYPVRRESGDIIAEVTLMRNKLIGLNAENTYKVKTLRF